MGVLNELFTAVGKLGEGLTAAGARQAGRSRLTEIYRNAAVNGVLEETHTPNARRITAMLAGERSEQAGRDDRSRRRNTNQDTEQSQPSSRGRTVQQIIHNVVSSPPQRGGGGGGGYSPGAGSIIAGMGGVFAQPPAFGGGGGEQPPIQGGGPAAAGGAGGGGGGGGGRSLGGILGNVVATVAGIATANPALVAKGLVGLTAAAAGAAAGLSTWSRHVADSERPLSRYSGQIANSFASLDQQTRMLDWQMGQATSGSVDWANKQRQALNEQMKGFWQSMNTFKNALAGGTMALLTWTAKIIEKTPLVGDSLRGWQEIFKWLEDKMGKNREPLPFTAFLEGMSQGPQGPDHNWRMPANRFPGE